MKTNHVSIACKACRSGKIKCTGQEPCVSCVRRHIHCEFDQAGHDGRTKEGRKRKAAEIESDSELLNELFETMRTSKEEGISQILTLMRSNAPIEDVKASVKQHIADMRQSKRERSPELEHFIAQVENNRVPRRKALDITLLIEAPPIDVPASPWTEVTDDNLLVSDLVSSWLIWDQYFYNWLDEDLFLRDMRSGDLNARYCSPFLVNAMLALACSYSDFSEAKTTKGKLSKLASNFLDEAKRLLDTDSSPSLTKVQGLGYLYVAVCVHGQDGLGYELIQKTVVMCRDLDQRQLEDDVIPITVLRKTCWGVFNLYAISMLAWQRSMQFSPPHSSPKQSPSKIKDWTPYPLSKDSTSSFSNELFERHSLLTTIAYDISLLWNRALPTPLNGEKLISQNRLEENMLALHRRLLNWHEELPDYLCPKSGSPPSVITHLAFYWRTVQTLATILLQNAEDISVETQQQAATWNLEAALEIEKLCRYHQTAYGNAHMSLYMIHPVLHSLFTLTDRTDAYEHQAEITNLCVFCRAMARRWPFCMAALRMYQVQMQTRGRKLPAETEKLFEDFEIGQWLNVELEEIKTMYPVPGDNGEEKRNMGDFLKAMDRLDIGSNKA